MSSYPMGIGTTLENLKLLCQGQDDLLEYLERARLDAIPILKPHGGDRSNIIYNVEKPAQQGTSRDYIIARLKRDAPDLAEQVINGKLTAAAAMRKYHAMDEPEVKVKIKVRRCKEI